MAATIAAAALASCGNSASEITKNESPKAVQAVAATASAENTAKAAENPAKTAQKNVQPAQTQKAAEAPASTQAPAAVIPDDVYPVWVEGDMFAGTYAEEIAGRGTMEITRNSDGTYSVEVNWSSSAFEKSSWNFSGEIDGRGAMNYTNCRKTAATYDANGNMIPCTIYSAGSGYIEFKDEGILEWHDDMGDILPGTTFVSKTAYSKTNTKANEVATAGSNYNESMGGYAGCNYVEETTATELPTGWFYDGNGSGSFMNITKNGNSYSFVVSYADEKGTCYHTYSFSGKLENGKVSYTGGQQDDIVYNADGSVKSAKFVSNDHKGQVRISNTGIVWEDSYGPHFVFISKAMKE